MRVINEKQINNIKILIKFIESQYKQGGGGGGGGGFQFEQIIKQKLNSRDLINFSGRRKKYFPVIVVVVLLHHLQSQFSTTVAAAARRPPSSPEFQSHQIYL